MNMNLKTLFNVAIAILTVIVTGCAAPSANEYGKWADALDASAW